MSDKGVENGYQLARDAQLAETTAYRLIKSDGRVTSFDSKVVRKLCDFWGKDPMQLIEWVEDRPNISKKRKTRG